MPERHSLMKWYMYIFSANLVERKLLVSLIRWLIAVASPVQYLGGSDANFVLFIKRKNI